MEIIIFGGDHLGKIPQQLHTHGVEMVRHITGRKQADLKTDIPPKVVTVLVLTTSVTVCRRVLKIPRNAGELKRFSRSAPWWRLVR